MTTNKQISDAYYRFPRNGFGPPTRLHVSPEVYDMMLEALAKRDGLISRKLLFLRCPVTEIPDLDGFRWVRERPNCWDCGKVHRVTGQ